MVQPGGQNSPFGQFFTGLEEGFETYLGGGAYSGPPLHSPLYGPRGDAYAPHVAQNILHPTPSATGPFTEYGAVAPVQLVRERQPRAPFRPVLDTLPTPTPAENNRPKPPPPEPRSTGGSKRGSKRTSPREYGSGFLRFYYQGRRIDG